MSSFIYFCILVIVVSLTNATSLTDVISFNTNTKEGYEGFVDERNRAVELKTSIKASITKKGISASGKICEFQLWSDSKEGPTLPFLVRRSDNQAVLKVKSGADLSNVHKREFNFFIQAFDCDPIRHHSVKVPVRLHLIPNERPIWSMKVYSFKIDEGKPAGTQVGNISASELGKSIGNAICKYDIVRPEDAPFDVDGNGVIYTRKELRASEVSNYILRVRAEDCWKPRPRSSIVSVNIQIVAVCKPGWHGVFAQLNYRAGRGSQPLFSDSDLGLVVSCDRAALPVRAVRVRLTLEPGDRTACPHSDGCPLSQREVLAPALAAGKRSGGPRAMTVEFRVASVAEAVRTMARQGLYYVNGDAEPVPSKRRVRIETRVELAANKSAPGVAEDLPAESVVVVLLPHLVPLLHPYVPRKDSSAAVTVPDSVLTGPGYPVLHDLQLTLPGDGGRAGRREPYVDFCVLRIHPKLTPVAYLEWPKEAVRQQKLKALNTSTQFNLKGVAPASVYRNILRQVRYHHAYPYALNSSSFVLVCLEHNSPNQDTSDSSMLVLKLRIQHENGVKTATSTSAAHKEVPASLHDPPPAIMHDKPMPSFEEVRPAAGAHKVRSSMRHHVDAAPAAVPTSSGTWSAGAVVGFVLGLIFLALATYLAVMRYRRYRTSLLVGGPPGQAGSELGGQPRFGFGGLRADSSERQVGANGLEMEWDNSELNITVNPMEESFTKYSQVVHYREFSSDDDADDDEDLSSLLSGIPEEGEEESARSCGSGSYGGAGVGIVGGGGGAGVGGGPADDQDWQWEDDMLPAYTHRPSPLGTANAHV